MTEEGELSWRNVAATVVVAFIVAAAGCATASAFWVTDIAAPQVSFLGSGNRLSVLVSDGPARLLLASGDDPIAYENALTRVLPLFARRVDVLLVAGDGRTLLVPLAAYSDPHTRSAYALAPLPSSLESDAFRTLTAFGGPRRIQLSPETRVTIETVVPFGTDASVSFPAWRATVERGNTAIVVLSDGAASSLFPPSLPASVLAVAGGDPAMVWADDTAVAFVAESSAIDGPDLRAALATADRPPKWAFRVAPGEALRFRFIPGGLEVPSESAQQLGGDTGAPIDVDPARTTLMLNRRERT